MTVNSNLPFFGPGPASPREQRVVVSPHATL